MQIIKDGITDITNVWYLKTTNDPTTLYRPSLFLLEKEADNGLLLCNTVTGELILLSEEEKKLFHSSPCFFNEQFKELITHKFLVPVEYNDIKELNQLKRILRLYEKSDNIINYNIVLTTYCNARCFYCYQSNYKREHMSKSVADKLIQFIVNHSNHRKINISWFGGEPLIARDVIDHICNGLSENKIVFESVMTSNCILFDKELAIHAKSTWKLKSVQVTIDGTEDIYNSVKDYIIELSNPYRRLLNNLKFLLECGIKVSVRLNVDTHNFDNMNALLDELAAYFSEYDIFTVYASLLKEKVGYQPIQHSQREHEELVEIGFKLEDRIKQFGFINKKINQLPHLKLSNCMANNPYSIQITPNGLLSKCEDHIFINTVGSVDKGVKETNILNWWKEEELYEECKSCAFIPVCPHLRNCPLNKHFCDPTSKRKIYKEHIEYMNNIYNNFKKTKIQ